MSGDASGGGTTRTTAILFSVVIAAAFIGFFVGIDQGVPGRTAGADAANPFAIRSSGTPASTDAASGERVIPAPSYADVRARPLGPTRDRTVSLERYAPRMPEEGTALEVDLDARRESLAMRSERRAYNGAPPVVPHAIEAADAGSCVACHTQGLQLAGLTARPLPHPYLENCLQCHAPPPPPIFDEALASPANDFVGIPAPFEGERAWPEAPPTIPHSTWMRDNCQACHGPGGWPGMQSTHPWRSQCTQCHAPSSRLDRSAVDGPSALLPALDVTKR